MTSSPLTRRTAIFALCLIVLIGAVLLSVSIGSAAIPASMSWAIIANKIAPGIVDPFWSPGKEIIIWNLRMPRALLGVIVGAGLGMAGAAMQGVTRNPLADPHLLGVSAGAALGANIAILVTGDIIGPLTTSAFAFAGAMAATLLVVALSGFSRASGATKLILAGVAVSFVITALTGILTVQADPRSLATVVFWMLGGLGLGQWDNLPYPAIALAVAMIVFLARARILNALAMGDETATTFGLAVARQRLIILTANAFLTGVLVAFSGMIGFVGLMMPHIARAIVGGNNRSVLPASAFLGAIFLVLSDVLARTITAPSELPVGIVTGIVGGLFFIMLLRR